MSSALPYPLAGLRRRKSARGWKEGREDETWEGGKVRIGGLVSSIPGEKRELPQVTADGSSSCVPLGMVKALNTIIKSNVILWLY